MNPRSEEPALARVSIWGLIILLLGTPALTSCKGESKPVKGEAPPEVTAPATDVCAKGGTEVLDPELSKLVPRSLEGFCLDPNDKPRAYGEGESKGLDSVCLELFNGECELYKSYGLSKVTSLRYVAGSGSASNIAVNLSRFAHEDGAFAFLSHRLLGRGDVAKLTVHPLELESWGAMGAGVGYVWRGVHVAELTYVSEVETVRQMKATAAQLLPAFLRELSTRLTGTRELPQLIKLLPEEERLPLGVRLEQKDALGISGLGAAASGYYARGKRRYVVFVAERVDEEGAKDVERTLRRLPGAKKLKDMPYSAFELRLSELGPLSVWLFGRNGSRIVGIGDDGLALSDGLTDDQRKEVVLERADKLRLLRSVMRR